MEGKTVVIENYKITVQRLIGKGKSGYSYLAVGENNEKYVLKEIHHEPCPSYKFDDKFQAELNAYNVLKDLVKTPKLLAYDREKEYILKEYVAGVVASELIAKDKINLKILQEIFDMTKILYPKKINLDFFPSNFVIDDKSTFYIDYEVNQYMDEWNFENWGIYFFANSKDKETLGNWRDR